MFIIPYFKLKLVDIHAYERKKEKFFLLPPPFSFNRSMQRSGGTCETLSGREVPVFATSTQWIKSLSNTFS